MRSKAANRGRGVALAFALSFLYLGTQTGCELLALLAALDFSGPPGISARVSLAEPTIPFEGETAPTGTLTLTPAFPRLTFQQPTFLGFVPGTNKLFVLEQVGRVRIFENDPNATQSEVLLDITSQVGQGGANERGLLALAFDPNFGTNGYFYVYYTGLGPSTFNAFLDRYQLTSMNPMRATPATRCQLLSVSQPQTNHNGGTLVFDRDGFLYLSLGDGGGANDSGTGHSPGGNAQDNTDELLGSLLRLRPDTSSPTSCGYSTAGNPFSNSAGNADLGGDREIFAFGLRHPWRVSFDRMTGDLWIGDVGQSAREEVDFMSRAQIDAVIAGRAPAPNFGWPCREGRIAGPIQSPSCDSAAERIDPIFEYVSGPQATVIGGYVYRGSRVPQLFGRYVYGNYGDQEIHALGVGNSTDARLLSTATTGGRIWSVGEDASGELYAVFGSTNQIRKLELAGGQAGVRFPSMLSATGLFQNTAGFVLAPGIVPFEPSSKLFSDNLDKQRFMAIPNGGRIRFSATGRFEFPAKSVILKHFTSGSRRIETRLLVRGTDQWRGYTYEWLPDQSDAALVPEAGKTIQLPDGKLYDLPSRADCQACHNRGSAAEPLQIIGLQARQLNFPFFYAQDANTGGAGVSDNQLRALNLAGFFSTDIGAPTQYGLFPNPVDTPNLAQLDNATLDRKARSYLESNCAICHRAGGGTPTPIDLQFDTPVAQTLIFGAAPGEGPVNGAQRIVDAGNPANSVLLQRMMIALPTDQGMPPISHRQVDAAGVALIREWIARAIDANGNAQP
jgi:glucose/arabinose dehydrogenase